MESGPYAGQAYLVDSDGQYLQLHNPQQSTETSTTTDSSGAVSATTNTTDDLNATSETAASGSGTATTSENIELFVPRSDVQAGDAATRENNPELFEFIDGLSAAEMAQYGYTQNADGSVSINGNKVVYTEEALNNPSNYVVNEEAKNQPGFDELIIQLSLIHI